MQEVVRHGSYPTKPNLTTPEIFEEFPRRTFSVSNTFLCPPPKKKENIPNQTSPRPTSSNPTLIYSTLIIPYP